MTADSGDPEERLRDAQESAYHGVREAFLTGVAVVVPILVTAYVLSVAAGVMTDLLVPLQFLLDELGVAANASAFIVNLAGIAFVVAITVLVGFAASFQSGKELLDQFDDVLERVPGIGAVYKSFRQMGDVMLESDADNFQSVKLVEFPHENAYTLGFSTTETPAPIATAAGHEEMQTLFLPLAPNPVMGGHLTHVPADRVTDVDMTVEEGMRAVVTMGVAISNDASDDDGLSQRRMEAIGGPDMVARNGDSE
jgi:uncharacterized membrane protein